MSAETLNLLETYEWPGNVRELENVLLRAMALAPGDEIQAEHVAVSIPGTDGRPASSNGTAYFGISARLFREARSEFETVFIERILRETRGNVSQAASAMELDRRSLQRKIRQLGIDTYLFENGSQCNGRPR